MAICRYIDFAVLAATDAILRPFSLEPRRQIVRCGFLAACFEVAANTSLQTIVTVAFQLGVSTADGPLS
jgi:hypothetical protein